MLSRKVFDLAQLCVGYNRREVSQSPVELELVIRKSDEARAVASPP